MRAARLGSSSVLLLCALLVSLRASAAATLAELADDAIWQCPTTALFLVPQLRVDSAWRESRWCCPAWPLTVAADSLVFVDKDGNCARDWCAIGGWADNNEAVLCATQEHEVATPSACCEKGSLCVSVGGLVAPGLPLPRSFDLENVPSFALPGTRSSDHDIRTSPNVKEEDALRFRCIKGRERYPADWLISVASPVMVWPRSGSNFPPLTGKFYDRTLAPTSASKQAQKADPIQNCKPKVDGEDGPCGKGVVGTPTATGCECPCPKFEGKQEFFPSWIRSDTLGESHCRIECGIGASCADIILPCPEGFTCTTDTSGEGGTKWVVKATPCPAGSRCSHNEKEPCLDGTYCPMGSATALDCGLGYYCPKPDGERLPCPAGSLCPNKFTQSPILCREAGTFCPPAYPANGPEKIPNCRDLKGMTCMPDADPSKGIVLPTACTAGYYCAVATSQPVTCDAPGNVCPPVTDKQQPCTEGWYCPVATQQVLCPSGHACKKGVAAPAPCRAGTFERDAGVAYGPETWLDDDGFAECHSSCAKWHWNSNGAVHCDSLSLSAIWLIIAMCLLFLALIAVILLIARSLNNGALPRFYLFLGQARRQHDSHWSQGLETRRNEVAQRLVRDVMLMPMSTLNQSPNQSPNANSRELANGGDAGNGAVSIAAGAGGRQILDQLQVLAQYRTLLHDLIEKCFLAPEFPPVLWLLCRYPDRLNAIELSAALASGMRPEVTEQWSAFRSKAEKCASNGDAADKPQQQPQLDSAGNVQLSSALQDATRELRSTLRIEFQLCASSWLQSKCTNSWFTISGIPFPPGDGAPPSLPWRTVAQCAWAAMRGDATPRAPIAAPYGADPAPSAEPSRVAAGSPARGEVERSVLAHEVSRSSRAPYMFSASPEASRIGKPSLSNKPSFSTLPHLPPRAGAAPPAINRTVTLANMARPAVGSVAVPTGAASTAGSSPSSSPPALTPVVPDEAAHSHARSPPQSPEPSGLRAGSSASPVSDAGSFPAGAPSSPSTPRAASHSATRGSLSGGGVMMTQFQRDLQSAMAGQSAPAATTAAAGGSSSAASAGDASAPSFTASGAGGALSPNQVDVSFLSHQRSSSAASLQRLNSVRLPQTEAELQAEALALQRAMVSGRTEWPRRASLNGTQPQQ